MMNATNTKRITTLLLSLLLVITIAACSSTASTSAAIPATTNTSASAASTSTATPLATTQALADTGGVLDASTITKLNLNTASAQYFLTIPGAGSRMVREFQEYKPYTSILQFRKEIGKYVSADQVAEYEKYVYVPVSVNQSDVDTLEQIPGVDASTAAALIAGRPYASNDAFLAQLAQTLSADQLAVAKAYLSSQ